MALAEKVHQIPALMDAEDMVTKPDHHCIMAYVSFFEKRVRLPVC